MTDMQLEMSSKVEGRISFGVCALGNYLTAGRSRFCNVNVADTPYWRETFSHLTRLKTENFNGLVEIQMGERKYNLDSSLWHELSLVLLAFFIHIDVTSIA